MHRLTIRLLTYDIGIHTHQLELLPSCIVDEAAQFVVDSLLVDSTEDVPSLEYVFPQSSVQVKHDGMHLVVARELHALGNKNMAWACLGKPTKVGDCYYIWEYLWLSG